MGTRSTIAIQNDDGTVTGVYCHWDGYLSHNGRILQENYTDEAGVRELISLGDMSVLGERVHPEHDTPHTFDNSQKGVTVYYGRDRGEKNVTAKTCDSWINFLNDFGEEYNYLFVPGEGWQARYSKDWGEKTLPLVKALEED
jgi:hypothetical protein